MAESIRLLHVDDEPEYTELTADFLERADERFTVEVESSASEALETLSEEQFDCIVSDYDMPGQTGIEFLESLRETDPDLPFILFTGKGSEEIASEAITAGATDYLQKRADTDQYELLANRVTNVVEQYRATQRAASLGRTRRVIGAVNQMLVRTDDRGEIERRTCEIISDAEPYRFAWIGEHDRDDGTVEPRAAAGDEDGYLDSIEIATDERPTARGPTATAVRSHEPAVVQYIADDPAYEPWREAALERGYRSSAAIPFVRDETLYGVLNVYANRANAFDDEELELLRELGDDIAHALEARRVRRELRGSKERFQALFENAPTPVIAGEIRDGGDRHVIRDANEAFEEVFDFDGEIVTGEDIADVVVPTDGIDKHGEFRDRAVAGKSSVAEVQRVTANGPREFLLHVVPFGGEDPAEGWFAWYSDISDQKQRQRELNRYEKIIQEMNDGVVFVEDEAITYTNPQIAQLTGYEPEELEGEPMVRFIAEEDRETVQTRFRERAGGEEPPSTYEISILPKEGEPIPVEIAVGLVDHDGHSGTVSIVRDITDRKRQERELQRRNERLDEFASIVSHELRNPLSVADGRLELARIECDNEHLDRTVQALDRMEKLIDNLLTLAREGQQVEDTEPIPLATVVERCWRNVDTQDASVSIDVDGTILAAPSRFQQLLENLIRNAAEHGGDDVSVAVGDVDGGFYVADDGDGIPEDQREDVFESGYSTTTDGTGFGLAIVEQIVEAHDWEIRLVESEDGGARFEVTGVELVEER